jgi:hypothetical protein
MQPLITTILDLDHALGGDAGLLIGGGLGLYLKQEHLRSTGDRTLVPHALLPTARTTEDIDLFLRAEVIASTAAVTRLRAALDELGFRVVQGSEWLRFARDVNGRCVLLDLMVGPLREHSNSVCVRDLRVRPKGLRGKFGVHAFATEAALGIESEPLRIPLEGVRSGGLRSRCDVLVPRAFPYVLMKLAAMRDRSGDPAKQEGRHHAIDLYRIVGLLTEEEAAVSERLACEHAGHAEIASARRTVDLLLAPPDGIGRLRLLEHQRMHRTSTPEVDPDLLVRELRRLLVPTSIDHASAGLAER